MSLVLIFVWLSGNHLRQFFPRMGIQYIDRYLNVFPSAIEASVFSFDEFQPPLSRFALSFHVCIGVLINNACIVMIGR